MASHKTRVEQASIPMSARAQLEQQVHRLNALHRLDRILFGVENQNQLVRACLDLFPEIIPEIRELQIYLLEETQNALVLKSALRQTSQPSRYLLSSLWEEQRIDHQIPIVVEKLSLREELDGEHDYVAWVSFLSPDDEMPLGLARIEFGNYPPQPAAIEVLSEAARSVSAVLAALRRAETETTRRQEAELMRDILGALASSADLNQTLELILVNLRNLVHYDTARLFLLDRSRSSTEIRKAYPAERGKSSFFEATEPVIRELQTSRKVLIVEDASMDPRLRSWPEMEAVGGWMGVPVFTGDEMIGFLSLGSLQVNAYQNQDTQLLEVFASQIGRILERAWLHEQEHRQSEELEVLSRITTALGQVENQESIFPTVIDQIADFYGAVRGIFFFPDKFQQELYVRFSQDPELQGMVLPHSNDVYWEVFHRQKARLIPNVQGYLRRHPYEHNKRLLKESHSAAVIPLKTSAGALGVLVLLFDRESPPLAKNLFFLDAVAAIAGFFLQRAMYLEAMEKQLQIRTRHLTTLYRINQVAGEEFDLNALLDQLLSITLEVMNSRSGVISLLDDEVGQRDEPSIKMIVQSELSNQVKDYLQSVDQDPFWEELLASENPMVIPKIEEEPRLPLQFRQVVGQNQNACILAPLRAAGKSLGFIGIFSDSILEYSIEDITLFVNVSDQIGSAVERLHLARQARQAAVIGERQRLARELHDSVTQLLYSQVLFAGAGKMVLEKYHPGELKENLDRIELGAQQALKEMRLLVYELRPSVYLQEGLVEALRYRLEAVEKRSGMQIDMQIDDSLSLDEVVELSLYRIIEEALNNILKHSSASRVGVLLHEENQHLVLVIEDNGFGFETEGLETKGGMGLQNIRDRAEELGGKFEIQSIPGEGTRILVKIGTSK